MNQANCSYHKLLLYYLSKFTNNLKISYLGIARLISSSARSCCWLFLSVVGVGSGVKLIDVSGFPSVSCNIQSTSCFDKAAALAGIGSLPIWLCVASGDNTFWATCFSGNSAGIVLVIVLSRFFTVELAPCFLSQNKGRY